MLALRSLSAASQVFVFLKEGPCGKPWLPFQPIEKWASQSTTLSSIRSAVRWPILLSANGLHTYTFTARSEMTSIYFNNTISIDDVKFTKLAYKATIGYFADYYPFGMSLDAAGEQYRYGYQGEYAEDETEETGYNSFQLRLYDPVIGRWISIDPYGQFASGYVGMGNNPINGVDPDGGFWQELGNWVHGNGWHTDQQVGDIAFEQNHGGILLKDVHISASKIESKGWSFKNSTVGKWLSYLEARVNLPGTASIGKGQGSDPVSAGKLRQGQRLILYAQSIVDAFSAMSKNRKVQLKTSNSTAKFQPKVNKSIDSRSNKIVQSGVYSKGLALAKSELSKAVLQPETERTLLKIDTLYYDTVRYSSTAIMYKVKYDSVFQTVKKW